MTNHTLHTAQETGEGWLLECDQCSRSLIYYKRPRQGEFFTIDRGDMRACHSWSNTPGMSLNVSVP